MSSEKMVRAFEEYQKRGKRGQMAYDGRMAIVMTPAQERAHDRSYRAWLVAQGKVVPEEQQTLRQLLTPRPDGGL